MADKADIINETLSAAFNFVPKKGSKWASLLSQVEASADDPRKAKALITRIIAGAKSKTVSQVQMLQAVKAAMNDDLESLTPGQLSFLSNKQNVPFISLVAQSPEAVDNYLDTQKTGTVINEKTGKPKKVRVKTTASSQLAPKGSSAQEVEAAESSLESLSTSGDPAENAMIREELAKRGIFVDENGDPTTKRKAAKATKATAKRVGKKPKKVVAGPPKVVETPVVEPPTPTPTPTPPGGLDVSAATEFEQPSTSTLPRNLEPPRESQVADSKFADLDADARDEIQKIIGVDFDNLESKEQDRIYKKYMSNKLSASDAPGTSRIVGKSAPVRPLAPSLQLALSQLGIDPSKFKGGVGNQSAAAVIAIADKINELESMGADAESIQELRETLTKDSKLFDIVQTGGDVKNTATGKTSPVSDEVHERMSSFTKKFRMVRAETIDATTEKNRVAKAKKDADDLAAAALENEKAAAKAATAAASKAADTGGLVGKASRAGKKLGRFLLEKPYQGMGLGLLGSALLSSFGGAKDFFRERAESAAIASPQAELLDMVPRRTTQEMLDDLQNERHAQSSIGGAFSSVSPQITQLLQRLSQPPMTAQQRYIGPNHLISQMQSGQTSIPDLLSMLGAQ